ncbi:hypothetical protein HFO28_25320 [Rhizobium leguminosarum]|uniref:hypothetical protein n=1 Tax=Rhizobium leguminosarum TaxID=384 RepID=UPI001C94A793|nr:hypothetical protein [Rhizobium leguminosarum]MBY5746875.1 hypothetical protein [Rhizobium leguminosarum]
MRRINLARKSLLVTVSVGAMLLGAPVDAADITYHRLSNETDFPFLKNGRPAYDLPQAGAGYRDSIMRFPDVRACLKKGERSKAKPDLSQVDWTAMRLTKDFDVCIFRILSSIADIEESRRWFLDQGFAVRPVRQEPASPAWAKSPLISRYAVSIEKHRFNQKIGYQLNFIQVWALRGVSAQVAASDNQEALAVTLTLTFL